MARVTFWNVRGTIGDVCGPRVAPKGRSGWAGHVLKGSDVVVLTESGYVEATHSALMREWEEVEGWTRVVCTQRPHDPWHGGVAVFVRNGGCVKAQLVKDRAEMGMAWVRLTVGGGRVVHMAACYLPPESSSYYGLERGALSLDEHYADLHKHVAQYAARGEVLIVGDLNARTGDKSDREEGAVGGILGQLMGQIDAGVGICVGGRQSSDRVFGGGEKVVGAVS